MRKVIIIPLLFCCLFAMAQDSERIATEDLTTLQQMEDSLRIVFEGVRTSTSLDERMAANAAFIPLLVNTLKTPNSFYYPFDSLQNVSVEYDPGKTFRILTWVVVQHDGAFDNVTYKYYGAIQKNNPEKLELYPLLDQSLEMGSPETKEGADSKNWFGSIYYNIVPYQKGDFNYFLLFGWDGHNNKTEKKLIDILYFDEEGKPRFGHPLFTAFTEKGETRIISRFILEYKEGSLVNLNYDKEKDAIVYDHLVPESEEAAKAKKRSQYVPDGTYEAYVFDGTYWNIDPKVFEESPLLDTFKERNRREEPQVKRKKKKRNKNKKMRIQQGR